MAPKVQGALRKELAAKAFDLHIKRDTNVEIAAKLDISRKLVPTLIREELPVSEKSSSRKPAVPKVATYRITSHPGEYWGRF